MILGERETARGLGIIVREGAHKPPRSEMGGHLYMAIWPVRMRFRLHKISPHLKGLYKPFKTPLNVGSKAFEMPFEGFLKAFRRPCNCLCKTSQRPFKEKSCPN